MFDRTQAQEAKHNLLSDADSLTLEDIVDEGKREKERPISQLESLIEPGGKQRHSFYLQPWFRISVVSIVIGGLFLLAYNSFKSRPTSYAAQNESERVKSLLGQVQDLQNKNDELQQENIELTQGDEIGRLDPNKREGAVPPSGQVPSDKKSTAKSNTPPSFSRRKQVTPRNTVRVPRYPSPRRTTQIAKPPQSAFSQPAKSSGPSLSDCAEFVRQDLNVPACKKHRITLKNKAQEKPITLGQTKNQANRKPISLKKLNRLKTPTKVAYAQQRRKSNSQVNFAIGQIQTDAQFKEEFYGSETQSPAGSTYERMKAKVEDNVDWPNSQEAQKMIISLVITSGSRKGQYAEARITPINETQFTAHVTKINGQTIEPGTLELRRKGTRILKADIQTQGGKNDFGNKLLNTAAAIGGEVVSDRLANVRGGNHVSRLVGQNSFNSARSPVGQYLRFKSGEVELVPINQS